MPRLNAYHRTHICAGHAIGHELPSVRGKAARRNEPPKRLRGELADADCCDVGAGGHFPGASSADMSGAETNPLRPQINKRGSAAADKEGNTGTATILD